MPSTLSKSATPMSPSSPAPQLRSSANSPPPTGSTAKTASAITATLQPAATPNQLTQQTPSSKPSAPTPESKLSHSARSPISPQLSLASRTSQNLFTAASSWAAIPAAKATLPPPPNSTSGSIPKPPA